MVRIDSKKKFGFSLVEVLVSMLLMSVMFLAITKVTTRKPTKETEHTPHGYYECIQRDGTINEYRSQTNKDQGKMVHEGVNHCTFEPQNGVYFLNVNVLDSANNRFLSTKEMLFNEKVELASPAAILNDYASYADAAQNENRARLEAEIETLKAEKIELNTTLQTMNSTYSEWLEEYGPLQQATVNAVGTPSYSELWNQANNLLTRLNNLNNDITQTRERINQINTDIKKLEEQLASTPFQVPDIEKQQQEFTTYLKVSHPDSQTYNLLNSGNIPDQILFIAW